ncbi:MAG: hypothetical protein IPO78_02420 [Saprospiraceae bacterium]|nr:hypothetical protein [Saprospiraceae bacterium]MBK9720457.1 hypothetical protein [Saprospiraceae bacterium]
MKIIYINDSFSIDWTAKYAGFSRQPKDVFRTGLKDSSTLPYEYLLQAYLDMQRDPIKSL